MASTIEISERITFYENKILEYQNNQKFQNRLDVTEKILNFWKNQLSNQQKTHGRSNQNIHKEN